ncbi:MAG TPA: peptidase M19 [Candidatus Hydrogenedentes bacterium]|nr:peptidase M19 [Candidatus Hydrogenedentota bacterium]
MVLLLAIIFAAVLAIALVFWLPRGVGASLNRVLRQGPYPVSAATHALHQRLLVADLHCDALLWRRNILRRGRWGHADLPRLLEGNAAIQVFASVTRVPVQAYRMAGTPDRWDVITPLALLQGWPVATWRSPRARARYAAARMDALIRESDGRLVLLRSREELDRFLARRAGGTACCGAVLSIEGMHALEHDLDNIRVFFDAGFRMMGLTHFHDNEVGGSAHGAAAGGLTPFGREAIHLMESAGIIIDLAHAAPRLIDDVLECAARPVVVSHTGFQAICPGPRNLSDAHLQHIAEKGGLVGVGFWPQAVGGNDAAAIARAIRHAVRVAGAPHVALGSDFDGAVPMPFDASGMPLITEALLREGFSESEIAAVMGGNLVRFLQKTLPGTA